MPGRYATRDEQPLESFGAMRVEITTPAGAPLQLAAGREATVRIPVAGRSRHAPATMPMFHLDEATGRWVEEGSARLVGSGAAAHYEGAVRHFSVWNVDAVVDTVWVSGCVRDPAGAAPSRGVVQSQGLDYAGEAGSTLEAGRFRVGMRRGSVAHIVARSGGLLSSPLVVGPFATDVDLGADCLVLTPIAHVPRIVVPPMTHSVFEGRSAHFLVLAMGSDLRYQWLRDGTAIPGATSSVLVIPSVSAADADAQFSVVVTNEHGSDRSGSAAVVVRPLPPPFAPEAARMMQLAFLPFALEGLMSPVGDVMGEEFALLPPQQVCRSGSIDPALINGRPIVAGDVLPWGSSRMELQFRDCATEPGVPALNGGALVAQSVERADQRLLWRGRSTLLRLGNSAWMMDGAGTFALDATPAATEEVYQFAAGTVLEDGRLQTSVMFLSGSFSRRTTLDANEQWVTRTETSHDVRFDIAGEEFSVNGQLEAGRGGVCGGDGLTVTRQGQRIGRLFCEGPLWLVEINGVVSPYVLPTELPFAKVGPGAKPARR